MWLGHSQLMQPVYVQKARHLEKSTGDRERRLRSIGYSWPSATRKLNEPEEDDSDETGDGVDDFNVLEFAAC